MDWIRHTFFENTVPILSTLQFQMIGHNQTMQKNSPLQTAYISRRFFVTLALVSTFGLTKNIWGQDKGLTSGTAPTAPTAPIPQNFKYLQDPLKSPRLVGKGNYTYWGFDVYSASLWASDIALKPIDWAEQRSPALLSQWKRGFWPAVDLKL